MGEGSRAAAASWRRLLKNSRITDAHSSRRMPLLTRMSGWNAWRLGDNTPAATGLWGAAVCEQPHPAAGCPNQGVWSAVHDGAQPGLQDSACAHWTRLQCDIQCALQQPPLAECPGSLSDAQYLCMGCGVAFPLGVVVTVADDEPLWTSTAPTGTSPSAAPFLASSNARHMNFRSSLSWAVDSRLLAALFATWKADPRDCHPWCGSLHLYLLLLKGECLIMTEPAVAGG
eukprot:CAMPEP_0117651918 /NCGR_PEP_ID=MMETSP0804-20121206/2349_1 /TAXON_ID=1074897 /ORGANISM="Tetraselmis astigmatica, Strain CCMP880" /LENGTH=228 /DNA_ID=CAMNT_0005457929 /DNA_START=244 /DNA_END=930 /DNA_ORIENTATION=+